MQPREPGPWRPAYWHGKLGMSLAGSDQAPAVVVLWAGMECTYTAWAHAGACPELLPTLTTYILTFPTKPVPSHSFL